MIPGDEKCENLIKTQLFVQNNDCKRTIMDKLTPKVKVVMQQFAMIVCMDTTSEKNRSDLFVFHPGFLECSYLSVYDHDDCEV